MAIFLVVASQIAEQFNPDAALKINPLNDSARIAALVGGLQNATADKQALAQVAQTGSALSPSDGSYLSLLGLIELDPSAPDQSQPRFSAALRITPTEIQALLHSFAYALSKNDSDLAIRHLSVISRRWPDQWSRVVPYLPALLATREGLAAAASVIGDNTESRRQMISSLTADPATTPLAANLLNAWKTRGVPADELRRLTRNTSNALFKNEQYDQAYFLFRQMMDEEQEDIAGYVHNGRFQQKPTGAMFDWVISAQTGARMTLGPSGLNIRFLDAPVRFSGLQQYLRLPPGSFSLRIDYSTLDLRAPKPLKFVLSCLPGPELAQTELSAGTNATTTAQAAFTVPGTGCKAIRLSLANDFQALSWSNRYSGELSVHEVSVQRQDSANP